MEVVSVKPVLFEADNTNYDHNGIGVLYDALSCIVNEEYNGAFDVELEYPVDGEWANEILEGRQILAKPNDVDAPHAFRIYEVAKDLEEGVIFARATSITDDLSANLITSVSVIDVTPQQALTEIKANLIESTLFDFVSDIETRSSSEWTRINPLQAIAGTSGSLVDLWGGDIKRTNNTVYLYSRRGQDRVTVIRPGKNINGFNMVVSTKGIITKILPYYTYTPESIPSYEMVLDYEGNLVKQQTYGENPNERPDPVTVMGDVVVSENSTKYAVNYYSPVDYSQNEYITSQVSAFIDAKKQEAESSSGIIDNSGFSEELQNYILGLLNEEASGYFIYTYPGCDEPSVEIKADMVQLSDSPEWERYKNLETIQITDTVDVYVQKFNVDVEVTIQAISYDSIGEKVLTITAGSARNNLSESITKTYDDKTKELQDYITNVENGVYNSISRTADGQGRRFSGYTEPPASVSSEGDLWYKEVGQGKVEIYIYKGGLWVPLVSAAVSESVTQAISDAKGTAEDAAASAEAVSAELNSIAADNGYTTLADYLASKVSNDSYGTLFAQNAKSIGLFYEVNGVTEAMILLDNGTPYIKGNNIVLDGNTIVDGTFTVTDTMLANDAVINHLMATGIDAQDVRLVNLDASNIVAGDLELSHGLRITHNGVPVLEVDATTGQVKITAPNLATHEDLQNIELTPGPQGEQGIEGPPGTSSYTHIAWADSADGVTNFSTSDSEDKLYVGMCVTTTLADPTTPASYKWTLIKGADGSQGIEGPPGPDGQTPYLHIAYATNSTGTSGFSITDATGRLYIGTYTDFISDDSTDPTKYSWALIKGDKGDTGPQGPQGIQGIQGPVGPDGTAQYVHIRYSANADGSGMTTTPQSNTAYIGLVNTTSSTAPTTNTSYKWSNFKGPQGDQGIEGPPGPDGVTTYSWVRYAIDEYGGNMSDTPDGRRYIGLAFNKTTPTESDSASDYKWSPLYDNVTIGGRNIFRNSNLATGDFTNWSNVDVNFTVDNTNLFQGNNTLKFVYTSGIYPIASSNSIDVQNTIGEQMTLSVWGLIPSGVTLSNAPYIEIASYSDDSISPQGGANPSIDDLQISLPTVGDGLWHKYSVTVTVPSTNAYGKVLSVKGNLRFRGDNSPTSADTFWYALPKLEYSNVASDWSPDPEDIQTRINNKSESSDMDALASLVSSVSADLNLKAGMGELQAMQEAFDERVKQDIADKDQLATDLATIEGRTTLVETIAGNTKLVTDFINTVITESEEGIYIANGASKTGILIASDRISFMDNNVEVAYINNQTMQINHGIFVQSATIGDFKFEKIPGTTILAITWVGD